MSSVNKVILVGNVGRDPEVRYLDNNVSVANFTLATTERGYTAQNGTVIPDKTEWHNIVAWRGLADISERFIKKGSQIYVEGKLRTRSWDDKEGNKRYVTEIYADNLQLLGSRRQENSDGSATPAKPVPVEQPAVAVSTEAVSSDAGADDLPF